MTRLMNLLINNTQARLSTGRAFGLAVCLLIFFLIASAYVRIPPLVQKKTVETLYAAGFNKVEVGTSSWEGLSHVALEGVRLDSLGLEKIDKIAVKISPFSFFFDRVVDGLEISGLVLKRPFPSFSYALQKNFIGTKLHTLLPKGDLLLTNSQITILTQTAGPLTFALNGSLSPQRNGEDNKKQGHKIKATLVGHQPSLGIESHWSGHFGSDGSVDIVVDIPSGRAQIGALQISRFSGWSALRLTSNDYNIQTQVEAGRATFLDIPLQKLSLVGGITPDVSQISARAGVSGWPTMRLMIDFLQSKNAATQGQILFSGTPLGPLLKERERQKIKQTAIPTILMDIKDFSFKAIYESDRRFAGGPLPFSFSFEAEGKTALKGNVLFYPEQVDIRGSSEGEPTFIKALEEFFGLSSVSSSGEYAKESRILRIGKGR